MADREISNVEKTALYTCFYRTLCAGQLFDGSLDERMCAVLSQGDKEEMRSMSIPGLHDTHMMAVRTVALDDQLLRATGVSATQPPDSTQPAVQQAYIKQLRPLSSLPVANIRQVVLLGAGMDPRAWRLPWPKGVIVYEVDTGTTEALKSKLLSGVPLRCAARHTIRADLSHWEQAAQGLKDAGYDAAQPTVWVLEGLIGYLSRDQALSLLTGIYQLTARGSQLLMTCPPTVEIQQERERVGKKLHHQTFEEPEDTLKRVHAAGWVSAELVSSETLSAAYNIPCRQPQIHAVK